MINFKEYLTENWGNLKGLPPRILKIISKQNAYAIGQKSKYKHFKDPRGLRNILPEIEKAAKKLDGSGFIFYLFPENGIIYRDTQSAVSEKLIKYHKEEIYMFSLDNEKARKQYLRKKLKKELKRISSGGLVDVNAFKLLFKNRMKSELHKQNVSELLSFRIDSYSKNGKISLNDIKTLLDQVK